MSPRTTHGVRRVIEAAKSQWDEPWDQCMWTGTPAKPAPRCERPAEYRNQLWSGHVVETCGKHTPATPEYRQHPRGRS